MCINQFHSPTVLWGRYCKVCKSEKWNPERLSHLSKVTLLGSSVDQVVNPRPCIPNPFLIPPFMPKPHFTDGCWGWKGARERSCHWQWQPILWNSRACMLSLHPQALALHSSPAPDPSLSLPHLPCPCPFPVDEAATSTPMAHHSRMLSSHSTECPLPVLAVYDSWRASCESKPAAELTVKDLPTPFCSPRAGPGLQ